MHYELWDMVSRNMLVDFDTEADALTAIRELLDVNEPEMAADLVLLWRNGDQGGTLAEGAELAARARATDTTRDTVSA